GVPRRGARSARSRRAIARARACVRRRRPASLSAPSYRRPRACCWIAGRACSARPDAWSPPGRPPPRRWGGPRERQPAEMAEVGAAGNRQRGPIAGLGGLELQHLELRQRRPHHRFHALVAELSLLANRDALGPRRRVLPEGLPSRGQEKRGVEL